ncbi:hypothetical protein [Craterilacuibacter sp.]|uniref:hypothetical protein n=1 Tax=Craterilacuibacter sp. TaxID=2870909 RepID=UPI003F3F4176
MSRFDFLSFGSGKKKPAGPFLSAASASEWMQQLVTEHGPAANEALCEELARFNESASVGMLTADTLEALLTLNRLSQPLQAKLRTQYLMSVRLPKVLETQLRNQISYYSKLFCMVYQRFLMAEPAGPDRARIHALLPLAIARMMYYQSEAALWQYFRHFSPDNVFWTNVHQLYHLAETRGMASTPLFLFDEERGTTVQDQYLVLLLVSLTASGNLLPRQINMTYLLAQRLSSRTSLLADKAVEASFAVNLAMGAPPARPFASAASTMRYWETSELVEQLNSWLIMLDSGRMPDELKALQEPGLDASLLRYLLREWASKPYHFERAQRLPISGKSLEVAHRLPLLHKLIREPDEEKMAREKEASFSDEAGELRIYGFVTSRSRTRATAAGAKSDDAPKVPLPVCLVDNQSDSGLGISLDAIGNEWVTLGALLGFRDGSETQWSLGIVRRIKRPAPERIYLGVEILSARPVAASLRTEDGGVQRPALPIERVWLGGEIALFVPCVREGRKINALVLAISSYSLGKPFYMTARGRHFMVALGKVQDKGSDWCLCEIELIKSLEALP